MADQQLRITLLGSVSGAKPAQRATVASLGLRRRHQTVTKPDRPEIRGMLARVAHLVEVRYTADDEVLGIEPGQEPKGAGNPVAGGTVDDDEVAELRQAEQEALEVAQDDAATEDATDDEDAR